MEAVEDDRFFVQAVGGLTQIEGNAGADRYYVARNASMALFSPAGHFDDISTDPVKVLRGTLSQMGGLTIDTGAGGNGGTRGCHLPELRRRHHRA